MECYNSCSRFIVFHSCRCRRCCCSFIIAIITFFRDTLQVFSAALFNIATLFIHLGSPPLRSSVYGSLWIMRKHMYTVRMRNECEGEIRVFHLKFARLIALCAQGECGSSQANYKFRNLDKKASRQIWIDFLSLSESIITYLERIYLYDLTYTQVKSRPKSVHAFSTRVQATGRMTNLTCFIWPSGKKEREVMWERGKTVLHAVEVHKLRPIRNCLSERMPRLIAWSAQIRKLAEHTHSRCARNGPQQAQEREREWEGKRGRAAQLENKSRAKYLLYNGKRQKGILTFGQV